MLDRVVTGDDVAQMMNEMGSRARAAARTLAITPPQTKTEALLAMARALRASTDAIIAANGRDMEAGRKAGSPTPCWTGWN
jgi:glutamate-5-semialdehyde dehydrogenase